jgi:zinc transport system substrate-binding protein
MNQSRAALVAIATVIPLAMAATVYTGSPAQEQALPGKPRVVASFYPLYEFASRMAGDRATVTSLVPAGIEPHDWEPTSSDASSVRAASMLVINGAGFESWAGRVGARVVIDTSEGIEFGRNSNPHIWLDPVMAKHQVEKIRDALVQADPGNAGYYSENANRFLAELDSLDAFTRSQLADCDKSDFIAFHDTFSHFAERYGLVQHSIQGASPEGEILPQRIAQVISLARELGINVVYSEEMVDSRLADTIAGEIPGGRVLVLSPIEGIDAAEQKAGIGYIDKMKENVMNLKVGLECR